MLETHGVTCDNCGKYYHLIGRFFKERIEEIKKSGWKIKKFHDLWYHYCPDCEIPQPKRKELWYDKD